MQNLRLETCSLLTIKQFLQHPKMTYKKPNILKPKKTIVKSLEPKKVIAFHGIETKRSNICIVNTCLQQISHFKYIRCDILYEFERDIENKIATLNIMFETIRSTKGNKCKKDILLKF